MSRILLDANSTNPGPWVRTEDVQHTVFASATDWDGATVSIEIGYDGENAVGAAALEFTEDGYNNLTVGRRTWMRASYAGGTPVGLKVAVSGG